MAGYGIPEADIACVLEIDPKTLRRHYRRELDKGHIKANSKVAENLYRKATGEGREAVTAAIFWLKTRAGWRETMVQESRGEVTQIVRHIVRLPEPARDADEWLQQHAPRTIEHDQPPTLIRSPMATNGREPH